MQSALDFPLLKLMRHRQSENSNIQTCTLNGSGHDIFEHELHKFSRLLTIFATLGSINWLPVVDEQLLMDKVFHSP